MSDGETALSSCASSLAQNHTGEASLALEMGYIPANLYCQQQHKYLQELLFSPATRSCNTPAGQPVPSLAQLVN